MSLSQEKQRTLPMSSGGSKQPSGHSVSEGRMGVATGKAVRDGDIGRVESGTGSVQVEDHVTQSSAQSQQKHVSSFGRPATSGSGPDCPPQPPDERWLPSEVEPTTGGKPSLSPRRRLFPAEGRYPRDFSSATVRQVRGMWCIH